MKRLVSLPIEQALCLTVLESRSPQVRAKILTETTPDDYGTKVGVESRERMDVLLTLGKDLGRALEFAEDPALTKETSEFIAATPKRREKARNFDKKEVENLIYRLKLHRNARVFHKALEDINEASLGKVDERKFEKMSSIMETTLMQVREGFNTQPLSHIGKRASTEEAKAKFRELLTFSPKKFISTGLPGLDKIIYGFERGNLVTISATRGGGKSTMAMNMGVNQYLLSNNNVCYVSMEMTEGELWKRVISNVSGVPHDVIRYSKIMTPKQRKTSGTAWKNFHKHGYDEDCTFTIWDVKDSYFTPMKLESFLAPFMYDVIIIDYVTLFHANRMSPIEMQLEYSRYLKNMAKRLGCVVVLLTQLNDEERVKYGKSIEENTDYWMWWRYREEEEAETGDVVLRLAKARHTRPRRLTSKFMFDVMKIDTSQSVVVSAKEGQEEENEENPTYGTVFGNY